MIIAIPALKDNYIWAIVANHHALIVDPGEALPVLNFLDKNKLTLSAILITHKHWDHSNGIDEIVTYRQVPVYGPITDAIYITNPLQNDAEINFPEMQMTFRALHIPGHTLEHIAYYGDGVLFCGDTLFTGGCGRVFEGTPQQMCDSLDKIMQLPDDTLIYCGHEYTQNNLRFAETVEPDNLVLQQRIEEVAEKRKKNEATVPSTLSLEKATNPFLRCQEKTVVNSAEIYANAKLENRVDVFANLRAWKNVF